MALTAAGMPFTRPRTIAAELGGDCYFYARAEAGAWLDAGAPAPELRVVHALTTQFPTGHGWCERDGHAWDWQLISDGREPVPVAAFYEAHEPIGVTSYSAEQALALPGSHDRIIATIVAVVARAAIAERWPDEATPFDHAAARFVRKVEAEALKRNAAPPW